MAKNLRRLAALAALPLLLAGCSQKVDFETFKEKAEAAVEARDDKEVSYLKIKGTWHAITTVSAVSKMSLLASVCG